MIEERVAPSTGLMESHEQASAPWHTSHGRGPPMVLLGGVHLDHRYLRPWLDPMGSTAQLIFVDHRGTGRSPWPDLSRFTHATWAGDVEALRRELDLGPIMLFGHSYGGFIALEYALRHPDALRCLVLCDTAAAFDYMDVAMEKAEELGTPEQLETLIRAFSAPVTDDAELERVWREVTPIYFHRFDDGVGTRFHEHATCSAAAFNHAYFNCLPGYSLTDRLADIDVPALILCGRHDWVAPVDPAAQQLARGLPHAELVVFERSGHYPFIEEQGDFVDVVRSWVEGIHRGTAA